MNKLLDSFWRAALYCLHPRVIVLSLLPLLLIGSVSLGLAYFFWNDAVEAIRLYLGSYAFFASAAQWLGGFGLGNLQGALAPMLLLVLTIPLIVIASLLFVALFMTPAMVALVAAKRFPLLEKKKGGSVMAGILWSLGSTLVAIVAFVISMPLWLIPPLFLVLPPLIWGWLTYRVMSYDALAEHASAMERKQVLRAHRTSLFVIGALSAYLGAAPSLIWASGVMFVALAPVLIPLAVWIYTLVFAFSSLWFAHYTLSALADLRALQTTAAPATGADIA